jgi:phthalate 4,5-dioxygenase oxygenase subunit
MLSVEQTEMLTRVGPGTPMGDLLRRYWTPVLLLEELPEPDCPPVRVRIFCEDLLAFRDTDGRVGLIEEHCAHRQTSLFYGRNEESGLRCAYHGWKFDVTGACVDMPTESAESNFKGKVRLTAYPARDAGGVVWAYLGPKELEPLELPQFRWLNASPEYRLHTKYLRECNYAQALDGGIDSVHTNFLHSGLDRYRRNEAFFERTKRESGDLDLYYRNIDSAPKFMVKRMDYGLLVGSRRDVAAEAKYYWRFNHFLMPFYSMTPRGGGGHAFVPIDDHNCWSFNLSDRTDRPFTEDERAEAKAGIAKDPDLAGGIHMNETIPGTYRALRNLHNDFLIDREMQRTLNFTGIPGTGTQDSMAQISMGPIENRMKEHLGVTDIAIIQSRKLMLQQAMDLREGIEPSEPWAADAYSIVGTQFVEDRDITFDECIARQHGALYASRSSPPVA